MNTPLIIQGLPRWDHPYASTAITLAKQFAKQVPVIYVEHPFTWKDNFDGSAAAAIKRREYLWKSGKEWHQPFADCPELTIVSPALHAPINFLPENLLYQKFRKQTSQRIARTVEKCLAEKGITEYIYVNSFDPIWNDLPEYTAPKALLKVYHGVDFMAGERYIARHGVKAENEAVKAADLVIATSEALQAHYAKWNPNTHTVFNGVDYRHFQQQQLSEPEDLKAIEGMKLVYAGNLGLRIDYTFIGEAAHFCPEVHWVLIGPVDGQEFKGEKLMELPNVHFLGPKPYAQLPAYLHYADACVIPFECNESTRYLYPLKINEYLAAGKPVLSTHFAHLPEFNGLVHYYSGLFSFAEAYQQALSANSQEEIARRKQQAAQSDWSTRAAQFIGFIEEALRAKSAQ